MASQTIDDRIVAVDETDSDRRQSFRMESFQENQAAKLKVGSKIVNVQIVDESAGGFLIEGVSLPDVKPSNHVELFTQSGAHLLRVAWRRKVGGAVRIGLQRLCQSPPQHGSSWLIWLVAAMVIGVGMGIIANDASLESLARLFGG